MEAPRLETGPEVAGWNTAVAKSLLMDEGAISAFRLDRVVSDHIVLEPNAAADENFVGFLVSAHDFYLARQDYKQAHSYGVKLYRMGREDVGAPLLYESAYLLATEELGKAAAALSDEDYRRAGDKGIWAAVHFGDAIRAGRMEAQDEFYAAAGIAIEANAHYGADVKAVEACIFEDCDEFGIPRPEDVVRAVRSRVYEEALRGDKFFRATTMLRLSRGLEELGLEVPGMTRLAAVTGIRDYFSGRADNFPDEYFKALEAQDFPKEAITELMLAAKRREYDINLFKGEHGSDNDVAAWAWFGVARSCLDLIKLGDESAREKLVHSLEQQIEAIDVDYFWLADGYGIEVHFDRYAENGLISDEKCQSLKQALREKFVEVRQQFIDRLDRPVNEYDQSTIDLIDGSITEYT